MNLKERKCPVCESDTSCRYKTLAGEFVGVREFVDLNYPGPSVVKCNVCDLVYLNPIMTDEEYIRFYNNDEQRKYATSITKETEEQYRLKVSKDDRRRADIVRTIVPPNGKVLDVGTGNSNFISLVNGAVGIDINEGRVKGAQKRGLDVRFCDIFDWESKVDCITLFHVLEHIPEPASFLYRVSKILDDSGHLIIEVPNVDDFLLKLDVYKNFYFQNAHVSYFTPKTLKRLLKQEGFLVSGEVRLQRYSFDNHLHWFIKGSPGKFSSMRPINPIYSAALRSLRNHDTIFFVCKKER